MIPAMTPDERRSTALLLWPETDGVDRTGGGPRPFRRSGAPRLPLRLAQAVAAKRGRIGWETHVVEPLVAARRAALGDAAAGEPRVLVRVDEFPHARGFDSAGPYGTNRFRRFHAVLAEAGIPYLLAITPRVSRDYLEPGVSEWRSLDDGELEGLRTLGDEGVVFGLHGLDHRTRHTSPRRHSELCGLSTDATAERIDLARGVFDELGLKTPVFVPPFNRFDPGQYELLAARFEVICGGPESIRLLGFAPTPVWRGEAVYLPSYPPLYETASAAAVGVERLVERQAAIWAPLTLHWGWEARDDFAGLRRLCRLLAERARAWEEFLRAVEASRAA